MRRLDDQLIYSLSAEREAGRLSNARLVVIFVLMAITVFALTYAWLGSHEPDPRIREITNARHQADRCGGFVQIVEGHVLVVGCDQ